MSTTKQSDPYRAIIDDLAYSYDGVFDREEISRTVHGARMMFEGPRPSLNSCRCSSPTTKKNPVSEGSHP